MNEREALLEVERLAREIFDGLDGASLTGECNSECDGGEECGKTSTVEAVCPKCSEKFDVESECDGVFTCSQTCFADVEVDMPDDDVERLKQLRLALVQLDLARAKDDPAIQLGGALGEGASRVIDQSILDSFGVEPTVSSWPGVPIYQPKATK